MADATLEDAIALAVEKFRGVQDKDGQPYVLHLLRVMMSVEHPEARIVGVLHDIVEDTSVTLSDLKDAGFSATVVEGVASLTHLSGISYCDYVIRIRSNEIARNYNPRQ